MKTTMDIYDGIDVYEYVLISLLSLQSGNGTGTGDNGGGHRKRKDKGGDKMNRDLYPVWVEDNYLCLRNKGSRYAVDLKRLAEAMRKVVEIWEKEVSIHETN